MPYGAPFGGLDSTAVLSLGGPLSKLKGRSTLGWGTWAYLAAIAQKRPQPKEKSI